MAFIGEQSNVVQARKRDPQSGGIRKIGGSTVAPSPR
jgi:hypothetical protein